MWTEQENYKTLLHVHYHTGLTKFQVKHQFPFQLFQFCFGSTHDMLHIDAKVLNSCLIG